MAYNASTVASRYAAAGNVPVLKSDFTKLAADLTSMQANMATGSNSRWKQLLLAEIPSTPATNIELYHINTGGNASTGTLGSWKQLLLDSSVVPGTNISIRHLKQAGTSFTLSTSFTFSVDFNSASATFNSSSITSFDSTKRINIVTPATFTADGGNNIQFWLLGQTTAVSSVPNNNLALGVYPSMGSIITTGAGTFHAPHFTYFGVNSTGTAISFTTTVKAWNIAES